MTVDGAPVDCIGHVEPMDREIVTADLTGIQPGARGIVRQIALLCREEFGAGLVTLLVHGSAARGGVIEGSSDVDFVAIVDPAVLTAGVELPLDRAMRFHLGLSRIDPTPFRYLQGYICTRESPPGLGFVPGAYQVVLGSRDVPHATGAGLIAAAEDALASFDPHAYRDRFSHALLCHGEDRIFRQVRWLCTDIWPMMYHIACLHVGDSVWTWQRTKHEIVELLAHDPIVGSPLQRWMKTVTRHYSAPETVNSALETLEAGVSFLDSAYAWGRLRLRRSDTTYA